MGEKTLKLLEDNIRDYLFDLGAAQNFLKTQKVQSRGKKTFKLGFIEMNFSALKNAIKQH